MNIDIITYSDEQYAAMTQEQLKEVRQAQEEKDDLKLKLEETLQKERDALVKKGIFNSNLYEMIKEKAQKEFEDKVAFIRECLVFYLRYSADPDGSGLDAPYEVNYALSYEARFNVVRSYYETEYTDGKERFEAFKLDRFALKYLGELYLPLYDYFLALAG